MTDQMQVDVDAVARATSQDERFVESVMRRIVDDLALVVDRTMAFDNLAVTRVFKRQAGPKQVHISFKIGVETRSGLGHGCLLVPLPDAIALACYLMMVPDESVKQRRRNTDLDRSTKDAMIEVANFVGGATDAAMRSLVREGLAARSEGCQGVRADVRPAIPYEAGSPLICARARFRLHTYEPFNVILMVPAVKELQAID